MTKAAIAAESNIPEDGIYFDFPETPYHLTGSLGSTNEKQLSVEPADFWCGSIYNKIDEDEEAEKEKESRMLGTANHTAILYGREAFEARYAPAWHNGSTREGKAESADIAAAGKIRLKGKHWKRILLAEAAIRANPHTANAFSGGANEVSIFWHDKNGIPKKARIDCLKIRANSDLKTIQPMDGTNFKRACKKQMASYSYHVQAEHYNEARRQIPRLLAEGRVFGDHDKMLLAKIAAQQEWSSVFVFLKKTSAPLTYGITISPGNPVLEKAREAIAHADTTYLAFREKFGFETPWLTQEPLEELDASELAPWAFELQ